MEQTIQYCWTNGGNRCRGVTSNTTCGFDETFEEEKASLSVTHAETAGPQVSVASFLDALM